MIFIGLGVAFIGLGVTFIGFGVTFIGFGVTFIGFGGVIFIGESLTLFADERCFAFL